MSHFKASKVEHRMDDFYAQIELIERVLISIDNKKTPVGIVIDLSKAFDTLDHTMLIRKLNHYGLPDSSLTLLQNHFN